ncbi:MAG: methylenetetrahydrofolate dehydrogenase / methenyltetrahydrofolate cyclohydrolase [Thermoleophilaceae bacterium]|jgi:methylenetetrahydrofolate dehydrogenase (NADP+)/methenyltetrahydrofolate cyclohydrolase|nr:methylenetetrahydrofolate dehydrogenase / methenyltetrahydrofolate cyclohydrolase [Thermoleophilaceae bacterium]
MIIDGRQVGQGVRDRVKREVEELVASGGPQPGLATILVGDDPASQIYVRNKHEKSREAGMTSFNHVLPGDTPQDELADLIQQLNEDSSVHGILLQLPAPAQIDDDAMAALIDPMKDVDGLTPVSAGLLVAGRPGMVPATPAGCMELLRSVDTPLEGAEAVVIGRSMLVGKPVAALLLAANATVTHCHSRTRDLAAECRRADILVAAVGVPELITGDMVKEGVTVLDVGMNRTAGGLKGDVHFESVEAKARAITPVPGGVGPMTIAMLLQNTLTAARMQAGVAAPS